MNFQDAVRTCLQNYVTFSGRARRSEFWFFILFNLLVQVVAAILDSFLGDTGIMGAIASLALFLPGLAVSVRRLHDTGRSGWWVLLGLVPLVGIIVLIVWYANRGEDGPNRFGPDPRGGVVPGPQGFA
ncbi:DUF805 domain-containing protein, partial [Falsiroseomonas oryziterrae]|uniref:DUF805 domain-containing protein n=1 Tax=Falsiroseomonas oryziterrae TaxID=2911368 RepID=UPI001F241F50